ncbi:MAG: DUF2079 domain-containing protein [Ruminococcus callidus]|nr:DUF2079 domain-containing protein [Ruminococcus callidus]
MEKQEDLQQPQLAANETASSTLQQVEIPPPLTKRERMRDIFGTPAAAWFRMLISYLTVATMFMILNKLDDRPPLSDWMNYILAVPLSQVLSFTFLCFAIATALRYLLKWERFDKIFALCATSFFLLIALWRGSEFPAAVAGLLLLWIITSYTVDRNMLLQTRRLSKRVCIILVIALTLLVILFTGITQMYHHKIFGTSCFDLGIFVQMYHSIITDGTMQVTCERAKELSHLAVHVSPIYYLLAPVYFLFPRAETLLIAQPIIVFSGVLPLCWIAKNRRFSPWTTLCLCITYLFSSSLIGPCYFDFHENAFLPPLLMWLFWSIDRKRWWAFYLSGALILLVKEDAPLYLICIGLYLFTSKTSRLHGGILTAVSTIYFGIVTTCLRRFGDGVMSSRFSQFYLEQDGSFVELIVNAIKNPAYFLNHLISENALAFFFMVMLPLCFLPFLTKKLSRYFLLLPFVIMNLLVSASYNAAASVHYQYAFGTWTCLFYLSTLNWQDLKSMTRRKLVTAMACISFFSSYTMFTNNLWYREAYVEGKEHYTQMEEVMESIPEDASVACDDWHIPHLANRKIIYRLDADSAEEPSNTDFVIVREDLGKEDEKWIKKEQEKLKKEGYTVWDAVEGSFQVYVSPEYAAANPN